MEEMDIEYSRPQPERRAEAGTLEIDESIQAEAGEIGTQARE